MPASRNDSSSATRPARCSDCNSDAMAGFAAAHGYTPGTPARRAPRSASVERNVAEVCDSTHPPPPPRAPHKNQLAELLGKRDNDALRPADVG